MAVLKAADIQRFIAKPDFSYAVCLIFGKDQGLVSERADQIASNAGVDLKDPFSNIRLSADEAAADPLRISGEVHTVSMFGGQRLVRISGQTRRDLMRAIKPVLDDPPTDALVLIEAGDLVKTSGLRKNLEKSKLAACIPCYLDNAAALEQLIDEELTAKGFSIDRETREELRALLGENRRLSRNELGKLALYCQGMDRVTIEHVRAIVGDASAFAIDDVIDATALGRTEELQMLLPKALEAGISPDMILVHCLRHFQLLQKLRASLEKSGTGADMLVNSARPPIFFQRKQKVSAALKNWRMKNISRAQTRLDAMALECRRNPGGAGAVAGTTLLAIALEARALMRR